QLDIIEAHVEDARARGATVRHGITVTGILREGERARGVRWVSSAATARGEIEARFVLDGSGQRGVIGRAFREEDGIQRAISVTRYWRDAGGPPGDARANTVLEATPEGWIWSLPLQNGLRNVTIFAERDPALRTPGASLKKLYHETIAASRHTRGFVEGARKEGQWRIYDSTWYRPRRYAGPGWALIGDAADVIDPLSSQGVYKAMSSALAAAAVARTTLLYPERAQLARRFLEEEQRLFYGELVHAMSIAYRQVPRWLDGAFWRRRDQPHPCAIEPRRPQPAQRAARRDRLRRLGREGAIPGLRFALRPGARVEPRPVMRRGIIEEREVAIVAGRARAVEIDREPRLGVLLSLLDGDAAVRDLVGAYARAAGTPVSAALRERLMESLVDLHEEGVIGILGDDATP
ncbi:MAG: NAD(P)/FAD-dependent oxidoreductase, partial [Planctomycetota bacterium]